MYHLRTPRPTVFECVAARCCSQSARELPPHSGSQLQARLPGPKRSRAAFLCTWCASRRSLEAGWHAVFPDGPIAQASLGECAPRSSTSVPLPIVSNECRASLVSATHHSGAHLRPFRTSGGNGAVSLSTARSYTRDEHSRHTLHVPAVPRASSRSAARLGCLEKRAELLKQERRHLLLSPRVAHGKRCSAAPAHILDAIASLKVRPYRAGRRAKLPSRHAQLFKVPHSRAATTCMHNVRPL